MVILPVRKLTKVNEYRNKIDNKIDNKFIKFIKHQNIKDNNN